MKTVAKVFNITEPTLFVTLLVSALSATIIGILCCNLLASEWGKDPSKVVIDEMVGIFVALLWIPINWQSMLAAFILFRLFDIWKPIGVSHAENLQGGLGVMADDIVAGIYANVILQLLLLLGFLNYG